jgi:gp16 family phage-associated protein
MCHIRHTITLTIPASKELDRAVRAAFIAKGTTLNAWCTANGIARQTVDKALKGQRRSDRSRQMVKQLLRDALSIEELAA